MRKIFKKVLSILTACIVSVGCLTMVPTISVSAQEVNDVLQIPSEFVGYMSDCTSPTRSTTFIDASIEIRFTSAGMSVVINTDVNDTASVIGVKDVKVQKKKLIGWETVATTTGGETSGVSGCSLSFTYTGAEYGEYYRVCCTHYANVDEYRELPHETEWVKCTY